MLHKPADLWPGSALVLLSRRDDGTLAPTPAYWRHWLQRPELALVAESCRAETALHQSLLQDPLRRVAAPALAALEDTDVRDNYRHFLALRDAVQSAGSLQAWTLAQFRQGVSVPPLFVDLVLQAIVQSLLDDPVDALQARCAELFFRTQRVAVEQGRVLAADSDTVAHDAPTQGLGELGRLLAQAQVKALPQQLQVLGSDNVSRYWVEATRAEFRSSLLLDLTQQLSTDLGHGLQLTMTNARSGLKPLALLLQRWVQQLLGVVTTIEPVHRIEDAHWRWHVGLDVDATALLNDLYAGETVDDERRSRLISLFRLQFEQPAEMRADVAGVPVYLALMANPQGLLRLKPQNLLLNLPLAPRS